MLPKIISEISRFFEDDEMERLLTLKNAPGNRVDGQTWYRSLSEHQKLLQSSAWFQNKYLEYTKGTGDYNKFRRGYLDGYMRIYNITDAEAGVYECVVDTAVGTIYASSDVIVHGPPGPPGGVSALALTSTSGTIVWTDGAIYGRQIVSYRIEGKTDHNKTWVMLADQVRIQHKLKKLGIFVTTTFFLWLQRPLEYYLTIFGLQKFLHNL